MRIKPTFYDMLFDPCVFVSSLCEACVVALALTGCFGQDLLAG